MRKILILLVLSFLIYSCSKDDNNITNPPQQLDTNSILYEMTGIFDSLFCIGNYAVSLKYMSYWQNLTQQDSMTITFKYKSNGHNFDYGIMYDSVFSNNNYVILPKIIFVNDSVNFIPYSRKFCQEININNYQAYLYLLVPNYINTWLVIRDVKVTIKRYH